MTAPWLQPLLLVIALSACAHANRVEQAPAETVASGAAAYLPIVERVSDRVHVEARGEPLGPPPRTP